MKNEHDVLIGLQVRSGTERFSADFVLLLRNTDC